MMDIKKTKTKRTTQTKLAGRAEHGNQEDGNERNQGVQENMEVVNQQERRAPRSSIVNIGEFEEIIGYGERIPPDLVFPLQFSQSFLEGSNRMRQNAE